MLIDSHKLNKSDIFSENNLFYNENKQYFNTTIKKKKNKKYSYSNNQKLLLNALKDFSVKYDLDESKMTKSLKFILSFDELISIIRYTLETQIKLYNSLKDDSEDMKNIRHEFLNNLNYYIYSYEKVEQINTDVKSKINIKSNSDKENININLNNGKNKKLIKIMNKSQSYWIDDRKNGNNQNKKIEKYKEEKIAQENIKNNNSNNYIKTSKSYYRRNKGPKLFSPEKNKIKDKNPNNEEKRNNRKNIRDEKSHQPINTDFSQNPKDNIAKKKFNKSTEKRKSVKIIKKKNENKSLSIYTACENLKSSSFIFKKNRHREFNSTEQCDRNDFKKKKNNYDSNNNINKKKGSNNKIMYYNQNMMLGVKKQIITNNVPKPSNLANKFLQNGRKFITEFNGIKEEERKKQYYS